MASETSETAMSDTNIFERDLTKSASNTHLWRVKLLDGNRYSAKSAIREINRLAARSDDEQDLNKW